MLIWACEPPTLPTQQTMHLNMACSQYLKHAPPHQRVSAKLVFTLACLLAQVT